MSSTLSVWFSELLSMILKIWWIWKESANLWMFGTQRVVYQYSLSMIPCPALFGQNYRIYGNLIVWTSRIHSVSMISTTFIGKNRKINAQRWITFDIPEFRWEAWSEVRQLPGQQTDQTTEGLPGRQLQDGDDRAHQSGQFSLWRVEEYTHLRRQSQEHQDQGNEARRNWKSCSLSLLFMKRENASCCPFDLLNDLKKLSLPKKVFWPRSATG